MGVLQIPDYLNKVLKPLKNVFLVIAGITLVLMMLLTAVDVCMRYVFNSPVPGALEIVEFMMVVLVSFSLVVTAYENAHIEVELFVERLAPSVQNYILTITNLISFLFFSTITIQSVAYAEEQFQTGLTSAVLLIPHHPFIIAFTAALALLSLVTLMHFFINLTNIISRWIR